MNSATFWQAVRVLEIFEKKRLLEEEIQEIFKSGFLDDLCSATKNKNLAKVNHNQFRKLIRLEKIPLLLSSITLTIPGFMRKIAVSDIVESMKKRGWRVSMSENFSGLFLDAEINPSKEVKIRCHKIESSYDFQIISETGGEEKVKASLTDIFALIDAEINEQRLLIMQTLSGNIFYVRNNGGLLYRIWVNMGFAENSLFLGTEEVDYNFWSYSDDARYLYVPA